MTRPPIRVAIGLGCDRGASLATVEQALAEAVVLAGVDLEAVAVLATIEAKADEVAFLQLAGQRGWPLRFFSAAQLASVQVPNPSDTVLRYMGTPSVSEAASLLAAGASGNSDALLLEKHKLRGADGKHATVSIARCTDNAHLTTHPTERTL
jgi:cobalt-precorrin 5A hydrolase